jgi:glycosyltransferase involved in cell wall biosynthesis
MKLALVSPCFPPDTGGVAGHTAVLYFSLLKRAEVELFADRRFNCGAAGAVAEEIRRRGCGGVVMQYTPNLFGWRNLFPLFFLKALKKRGVKSLTLFHEIFMPEYRGLWREFVARPLNYLKDRACLLTTDYPAATFSHRTEALSRRFGLTVYRLPVFSNLPRYEAGPGRKEFLFSVFGSYHHDMNLSGILAALSFFKGERALFIGDAPETALTHPQVERAGFLPPAEAARAFHRARFFVLFDERGVSFRKGTVAAAMQNGIPVIANRTDWTDPEFRDNENVIFHDGTAGGLVSALRRLDRDEGLSRRIGLGGRRLYETHLDPDIIAARIIGIFGESTA